MYSFAACLVDLTIDHASPPRRSSTVPIPGREGRAGAMKRWRKGGGVGWGGVRWGGLG